MVFGRGCAPPGVGTCCAGGGFGGAGASFLRRLLRSGVFRMRAGRRGARLSTRAEFSRVYREGRRYAGESLVLYVRPTPEPRRIGVTAGRRIGGAVPRNRARRRLREALRRLEGRLCPHGDIVVVARAQAVTAPFAELVAEVESMCAAGRVLCGDGR